MTAGGRAASLAAMMARPIAHRGLHGCGRHAPVENTLAAARAAIAGDYGIECDVQLTRDGEAVVFHDDTLDRLTGVPGAIGGVDATDLAGLALADGSSIPTLRDLFDTVAGRVALVVEIKGPKDGRLVDRVLELASGYRGPLALESFDPSVVARCRAAPCPIGLVGPADGGPPEPATLERCDFVSWNIDHVAAFATGRPSLPLTTWTVRSPKHRAVARSCGAQIVFEGFCP